MKTLNFMRFLLSHERSFNFQLSTVVLLAFLLLTFNLRAQNVVITDDDTYTPTSTNALLEVKPGSNDKGVLIPRLTTTERTAITPHATNDKGLMVYDTDTKSFWYYNGTAWVEIGNTSSGMQDADGDTKIQVEETADEDNIRFDVAGTEAMVIDENARIGIGTTSPGAKLEIAKVAASADEDALKIGVDGEYNASIKFYDDDDESSQYFKITFGAQSQDLSFHSDDNDNILYMTQNGNVGIGTTSPSQKLDIHDGALSLFNSTNNKRWIIDYDASNDYFYIDEYGEGRHLTIKNGGNVGIGTTSPTQKLEVNGAVKIGSYTLPSTDGTNGQSLTTDGSGNISWLTDGGGLWSENSGDIYRSSGNVGIGTTNPAGLLDVYQQEGYENESVDQQQTSVNGFSSEFSLLWQSFTAGTNGYLSKIELWDAGSSIGTFTMKIYSGQGTGGTLLGTANTVSRNNNGYEYVSFTFPDPISVTSSQQYTFAVYVSGTRWDMDKDDSNPYSGGVVYYNGYMESSEDTRFKTYVGSYLAPVKFVVNDDGNVGIGTDNPSCPLEINGSNDIFANYGYLNPSGNTGTGSGTNQFSIKTSHRIMASEFNAVSDRRIKTNIVSSNMSSDLLKINKLRLTRYNYIDKIGKGNKTQKGFIAQEVEKVIPEAVNISSNFIPDIFVLSKKNEKQDNLLIIEISKNHNLQKGDMLKLIMPSGQIETEVVNIISEYSFAIETDKTPESIFVYGKKVDDFRAVNYDYIFSTGIGAIQELSKQNEELKMINVELKNKNNEIEARLEKLENIMLQTAMKR